MGWLIFIDILLIIVLALMLSVTVNVHLNDETRIKIKYAGITIFSVSPEDEKQKKQKQKKKQEKEKQAKSDKEPVSTDNTKAVEKRNKKDTDKPGKDNSGDSSHKVEKKAKNNDDGLLSKLGLGSDISEIIELVKQLIESASKPVKRLISHIRVNNFYLFVTASGEDAAQAAMNYGKINWIVYTAIAVLYEAVKLDVKKIDITADFSSGKTEYELSCKVKLRLGTAIGCAIWLLFRLLKMYLKINSKNVNNTAPAEKKAKPGAEKA